MLISLFSIYYKTEYFYCGNVVLADKSLKLELWICDVFIKHKNKADYNCLAELSQIRSFWILGLN